MRKAVWLLLIIMFFTANLVFAGNNIDFKTADGYISTHTKINNPSSNDDYDPVTVYSVTLAGTTAADEVCLYDGADSGGVDIRTGAKKPLIDIHVGANTTQTVYFPNGIAFEKDVWVDVNSATTGVTTIYSR